MVEQGGATDPLPVPRRPGDSSCSNFPSMRAVVQRVKRASVQVGGQTVGRIEAGFVALVGVARDDKSADADYLVEKIVELRVFEDETGKMNRSLGEVGGAVLAISQFTLLADCRKGRRPSFTDAAAPDAARPLFDHFVSGVRSRGIPIETGCFGATMQVALVNDGPVTILLDSK